MAVPLIFGKLLSDKRKLFWFLHSLFWMAHWGMGIFLYPQNTSSPGVFLVHSFDNAIGFSFCLVLRQLYKKMNWYRYSLGSLVPLVVIYSIVCGLFWEYSVQLNNAIFFGESELVKFSSLTYILRRIWYMSYPFIAWSAMYFGYKFWEEWNEQRLRFEQEQASAQRSQLAMLRYQLNPHFLFNTLSSLRGVMRSNLAQAEDMITQISEFLRYSLLNEKEGYVPFSREIEIVKHYLNIEMVRFRDKLSVHYEVDTLAEDFPVPVFLIHPLVENAIKHGMKTSSIPLLVNLKAEISDSTLRIEIRNSGQWIDNTQKTDDNNTGTGLSNTLKRLETSYPGRYKFDIQKGTDFVSVTIIIEGEPRKYGGETL